MHYWILAGLCLVAAFICGRSAIRNKRLKAVLYECQIERVFGCDQRGNEETFYFVKIGSYDHMVASGAAYKEMLKNLEILGLRPIGVKAYVRVLRQYPNANWNYQPEEGAHVVVDPTPGENASCTLIFGSNDVMPPCLFKRGDWVLCEEDPNKDRQFLVSDIADFIPKLREELSIR
jgi:hypothetical protein